jgi:hypothetical protein
MRILITEVDESRGIAQLEERSSKDGLAIRDKNLVQFHEHVGMLIVPRTSPATRITGGEVRGVK